MGFFDKSSSSSTTQNFTEVTTPTSGASDDSLSISSVGAVSYDVDTLDAGAIGEAFDFAGEGFDFSAERFDKAFAFASESLGLIKSVVTEGQKLQENSLDKALAYGQKSSDALADAVGESQSGGAQRLLYFAAAALAAIVLLPFAMRGFR